VAGSSYQGEWSFASWFQSFERWGSRVVFGGVLWETLLERIDKSFGGSLILEQGESIIKTFACSRIDCQDSTLTPLARQCQRQPIDCINAGHP